MKRFIRVSLVSLLTMTLLCAAVVFHGRREAAPAIIPEGAPCNATWCNLSLFSGDRRLNTSYSILIGQSPAQNELLTQPLGDVYVIDSPNLPAGNVTSVLGAPCYVTHWGKGHWRLGYAHASLYLYSPPDSLTPSSPVVAIFVPQSPGDFCAKAQLGAALGYYEWRGFHDYR